MSIYLNKTTWLMVISENQILFRSYLSTILENKSVWEVLCASILRIHKFNIWLSALVKTKFRPILFSEG